MISIKPILFIICLAAYTHTYAQTKAVFPLKLSDNKRYLVDKNNQPFLIKEFSAWGMIQVLSEKDASAFLDSIKQKGFNTILTSVVSNAPSQMGGDPPYWQGVSPFTVQWDFSTPNEKYFKHVDAIFKMAEAKGFLVMALPFYMGYRTDPSQGWWDELLSKNNDTAKTRSYGQFIGRRYKNISNIIWMAGGDNNCEGELYVHEKNMIEGVRAFDKDHLWCGHFDMNSGSVWSTDNKPFSEYMDIDGEYVWTESVLFERGPLYRSELAQYKKNKMIFQLDMSYEHDHPHFADNENYQWIRRKMYDGLLSGCAGTSFSSGMPGNYSLSFKNWKPLMNTEGMQYVSHCFKLFEKLPWYTLIPDETNNTITKGRENVGSIDYICAARAADSSCYVIYIPKGQSFEMNAKNISGKPMRMNWYDPRTGETIQIGTCEIRERYGINPPSEEDWVLVFYDTNLNLFGTN